MNDNILSISCHSVCNKRSFEIILNCDLFLELHFLKNNTLYIFNV